MLVVHVVLMLWAPLVCSCCMGSCCGFMLCGHVVSSCYVVMLFICVNVVWGDFVTKLS